MTATVSYQGLSLDVDPYHVEKIDGLLGSPDVRSSDRTRVSRDGLVMGTDYLGGRSVIITLDVSAADLDDFGDAVSALSAAFAGPRASEAPLTFTIPGVAGGNAARLYVRPRKVSVPIPSAYFNGLGVAAVEFFATDALLYSDSETTVSVNLAAAPGGRTYNRVYPMVYGGGGSYGSVTLTNAGTTTAPLVIQINGPVINPTVRNVTTGQSLGFTATIDTGDYLLIDTKARTVLLNGTADRYSYLTTPEWFGLDPGANELRYLADITSASTASFTWRSAWV